MKSLSRGCWVLRCLARERRDFGTFPRRAGTPVSQTCYTTIACQASPSSQGAGSTWRPGCGSPGGLCDHILLVASGRVQGGGCRLWLSAVPRDFSMNISPRLVMPNVGLRQGGHVHTHLRSHKRANTHTQTCTYAHARRLEVALCQQGRWAAGQF